jgi:hypothetical protein
MKVSIKFCGGCNPRIDRVGVAANIRNHFASERVEVVYNSLDADIIVYISGCQASCAMRYSESDKPSVVIAGSSVDSLAVEENGLVGIVIKKVGDYVAKLERTL